MPDPIKLYRRLLKFYPARFREEYGTPLEQQFADEYREAGGKLARFALWMRTLRDLGLSIPLEFARELRQDLSYSFRIYSRRPGVTLLAMTAMALAIGATTGVFSVVNALLLRSLPFRSPERLVQFGFAFEGPETPAAFHDWRLQNSYLDDVAKYAQNEVNLSGTSQSARVNLTESTWNLFQVLGREPEIGRSFAANEEAPGKNGVAIISHGLWQGFFGGDSRTLGSTIRVNGTPLTVIGIAPPGFDYPPKTAIWTPTVFEPAKVPKGVGLWHVTIGRLKPGVSLARAQSMLDVDRKRLEPDALKQNQQTPLKLVRLREQLAGLERLDLAAFVLLGAVSFVLLIACANVANLLLARVTERRKELVLRAALGASRARLIQQLITESVLLTGMSALAGMLVAEWVARLAAGAQPAHLSVQNYTILDWRVIGFAVLLAALTGFLFGVLPASLISRLQPAEEIERTTAEVSNTRIRRLRSILVGAQAAMTLALLGGSIVMGRGFLKMAGVDLGYSTDHVVTMSVSLDGTQHKDERQGQYYEAALDRLRQVPGVESAGAIDSLPLTTNMFMGDTVQLAGHDFGFASMMWITPGYFRTMKTALTLGRDFTSADNSATERVAIVNEEFARRAGQGQKLLGQKVKSAFGGGLLTIVGVVRSVHYSPNPAEQFLPAIFLPSAHSPFSHTTFAARVRGNTEAYLPICRDAIQSIDHQVPVFNVRTLDDRLAEDLARPRFYTTAVIFFGGFAMLLAMIGIYGVASYSIVQRTHELGVRIAIGASAQRMRWMLLRQSLLPVAVGMGAGIAGAVGLSQFLQHLLDGVQPVDAITCTAAAFVLAAVAAIAVWSATQRILRLDPMQVLRTE